MYQEPLGLHFPPSSPQTPSSPQANRHSVTFSLQNCHHITHFLGFLSKMGCREPSSFLLSHSKKITCQSTETKPAHGPFLALQFTLGKWRQGVKNIQCKDIPKFLNLRKLVVAPGLHIVPAFLSRMQIIQFPLSSASACLQIMQTPLSSICFGTFVVVRVSPSFFPVDIPRE